MSKHTDNTIDKDDEDTKCVLIVTVFLPVVLRGFVRYLVAWASMIKRLSHCQEHTRLAGESLT